MRSCTTIASNNCRHFRRWAGLSAHTRKKKTRILGNLGERKWKAQTSLVPSLLVKKNQFYCYLVENSQKATLNFYFKSKFSVKPSKFPKYFTHDCRYSHSVRCYMMLEWSFSTHVAARKRFYLQEIFLLQKNR